VQETDSKEADSQDQNDSKVSDVGSTFVPVEPFEIVVFGGTGDLARRKLIPSLYHRFCDGQIPAESKIKTGRRFARWLITRLLMLQQIKIGAV